MDLLLVSIISLVIMFPIAIQDFKHQEVSMYLVFIAFIWLVFSIYNLFALNGYNTTTLEFIIKVWFWIAVVSSFILYFLNRFTFADFVIIVATSTSIAGPVAFLGTVAISQLYPLISNRREELRKKNTFPFVTIYFLIYLLVFISILL